MNNLYGGDLRPGTRGQRRIEGLSDIDRLLASEQIRYTKALYCFCMDSNDWDGYEQAFVPNAVLEVPAHHEGEVPQRIEGSGPIRRFVQQSVAGVVTAHHCHTPIIEFLTPTTAAVTWAMEDMLRFPKGAQVSTLHGMGHYFERYRLDGDRWRITHCRLSRLRLEML